MKGNEFLNKMELIDPAYVEAADVTVTKRKIPWGKWIAMAACLCIVTVGAFAVPWDSGVNDISYIAPDTTGDLADEIAVDKNHPEDETGTPSVNSAVEVMTVPDTTPVTEPAIEPAISGPYYTPNNTEAVDPMPMISSYGDVSYVPGMTVTDGDVVFSDSLLAAMEHHGDNVNYRVLVEFFSGGNHVSSGGQTALDEMNRLSDLGYIVAFETYMETKEHGEYVEAEATYYFTIHATYEQLQNFAANDALGYSVMLYDEYFGVVRPLDMPIYNRVFFAANE